MKKMPIIFDMTFNKDGERKVLHTIRKEIRDLVNTTLADGGHIIPTFKRDGTAVFCDDDGKWFTRRAVKTGKHRFGDRPQHRHDIWLGAQGGFSNEEGP